MVPFLKYSRLPVAEKLLETKFCKSLFSSYVAFLIMSVASQKRHILRYCFPVEWKGKKSYKASVLLHCSLLRYLSLKPTGVLQLLVLRISGLFLLTASVGRRRSLVYISLFSASNPEDYTSEFLLIIVANSREFLKLLFINI